MQRLLLCLLVFAGFLAGGCENLKETEHRDVRLTDAQPQVEVTVQQ